LLCLYLLLFIYLLQINMKIENINRKILCSPGEFVEIFKEGKVEIGPTQIKSDIIGHHHPHTSPPLHPLPRGEQIRTFLAPVNPPQQVLKMMMGRNTNNNNNNNNNSNNINSDVNIDVQLKEQQEVIITKEGRIKIHTFYLPDILCDYFRVETFWNITEVSGENGENLIHLDISVHSESKVYVMGHLLEVFVANSVAASILQYLDIVDSYISKWRKKLKHFLQLDKLLKFHKKVTPVSPTKKNVISNSESAVISKNRNEFSKDPEQLLQKLAEDLELLKTEASENSQKILNAEILLSEKNEFIRPVKPVSSVPSMQRTISELWSFQIPQHSCDCILEQDYNIDEDFNRKSIQLLLEKAETAMQALQNNQEITHLKLIERIENIDKMTLEIEQQNNANNAPSNLLGQICKFVGPLSGVIVVGVIYTILQKKRYV